MPYFYSVLFSGFKQSLRNKPHRDMHKMDNEGFLVNWTVFVWHFRRQVAHAHPPSPQSRQNHEEVRGEEHFFCSQNRAEIFLNLQIGLYEYQKRRVLR